ncbi:MAG: hypothetical protein [Microviridae sp.]|nr:MAG: hypothetical protein [Microviridae sp.]
MLKLLKSIVQKQSSITQLKEEVQELREQIQDYESYRDNTTHVYSEVMQIVKDLVTVTQKQTQLIYNLKTRIEYVEKDIKTDSN